MMAFTVAVLTGFALAVSLTPLMRRVGLRTGIVDKPGGNGLKIHKAPIPCLGGGGVLIAVLAGAIAANLFVRAEDCRCLPGIAVGAVLVFGIGLWDDTRGASPRLRLLIHLLSGAIVLLTGLRVETVPVIWIAAPLTLFYVGGAINASNMIDGMDGLAAGLCALTSLGLALLGFLSTDSLLLIVSGAVLGSSLGFLRYNFHPARIFLGDNGSGLLGFLIGVLLVRSTSRPYDWTGVVVPILMFGVPVLDMAFAILRRLLARRPLSAGDRSHSYDLLLNRGLSQTKVWIIMCAAQAIMVAAGVAVALSQGLRLNI